MLSVLQQFITGDEPFPGPPPALPVRRPSPWQRRILRHRRLLLAGLGFLITVLTFSQLHPSRSGTVLVVVASHDLPSGTLLTSADLTLRSVSTDAASSDAVTRIDPLLRHPLVTPLFDGDVVRARDVLDLHLINQLGDGMVAIPVHVTPAAAAVVQRGDHVDVLSANPTGDAQSASSAIVASDVLVLIPSLSSAPTSVMGASSTSSGADVVVVARSAQAAAIAAANGQSTLMLALRGTAG